MILQSLKKDQSCPDGLLFNGTSCDWPENVQCVDKTKTDAEVRINRPCKTGIYQVRGTPSKFYQCTKGIKHQEQSCPAGRFETISVDLDENFKFWPWKGLLFNEKKGICDWAHNVEVLPAETAESCFDGVHGLWYWSDGYYYCYDNQRYYGWCPTGLTFNQEKSKLGCQYFHYIGWCLYLSIYVNS